MVATVSSVNKKTSWTSWNGLQFENAGGTCAWCCAHVRLWATNGPLEKFAVLQHSAACFKPLVGNLIFQKASKVANRYIKHKRMHLLTPCKDGHKIIISCVVKLLLLLVTFPLFVHFIDVHDCQMAQCLITHIETIVC